MRGRSSGWTTLLLACICMCSGLALAAPVGLTPIALSGQPIPGQGGLTYGTMNSNLAIAPDGSVVFQGSVNTTGTPLGVFAYNPTLGVRLAAQDFTSAPVNDPTLGPTSYNGFYAPPAAANGGQAIYNATTNPNYPNNVYYFHTSPSATGLAAPRYSDVMYIAPDSGNVAYTRGQNDSFTQSALMYGPPQAPITVATIGAPAAGVPGSNYFSLATISALNGGGVMFGSVLTNGGGTAVYHAPFPGYTPQLLARTGMPAAGIPGTPAVSNLHVHSASREGHVLVSGVITGAPINNDVALWTVDITGTMRLVVREGTPLPGTSGFSTTIFNGNVQDVDIGDGGHVAFKQNIGGTDGLWRWSFMENTLEMLNVPGRQIPGLPLGWRFGGTLGRPQLDQHGNAIFYDAVRDPTNAVKSALVWAGIDGQFKVIMRVGDMVDVNGTPKQVSFVGHPLTSFGNYWLSPRVLTDDYRVALSLNFTDGSSGVFIARVPEPPVAGIVVIAAGAWLLRRRQVDSGRKSTSLT